MDTLYNLSFEINDECPMTAVHDRCPRSHNRFRYYEKGEPITIEEIIDFTNFCISEFKFRGLICVNYYNEPLATKDRVIQMTKAFPNRVILYTNGLLFDNPFSPEDVEILNGINHTWVSEYRDTGLRDRLDGKPHIKFQEGSLDRRTEDVEPVFNQKNNFCKRIDLELAIDYYGYGHMCCADWKGEMYIGNIKRDNYCTFLQSWSNWKDFLRKGQPWLEEDFHILPNCCQMCLTRTPHLSKDASYG